MINANISDNDEHVDAHHNTCQFNRDSWQRGNIGAEIGDAVCEHVCKYQPSGTGGTRSPPAMPHHLQNPKLMLRGPKMGNSKY